MLSGGFVKIVRDTAVKRELVLIDRSHSKVEKVLRLADTLGISPFSIKSCLFLDHSYTALYIIFLKPLDQL